MSKPSCEDDEVKLCVLKGVERLRVHDVELRLVGKRKLFSRALCCGNHFLRKVNADGARAERSRQKRKKPRSRTDIEDVESTCVSFCGDRPISGFDLSEPAYLQGAGELKGARFPKAFGAPVPVAADARQNRLRCGFALTHVVRNLH